MTLPAEVQSHVDRIRALLGVPACQLVIDMDDSGNVQHVRPTMTFRRIAPRPTDRRANVIDKLDARGAP